MRSGDTSPALQLPAPDAVVDLSHPFSAALPLFPIYDPVQVADRFAVARDGFFARRWTFDEHAGTHVDAPAHFAPTGQTVDLINPRQLVLGIAVCDVRERVRRDHDTLVTPDDVLRWEARFGPLPDHCAVLALTGWADRAGDAATYLNADAAGVLHTPGFDGDTVAFLREERPQVRAVGLDAPSLDVGASTDFPAHVTWLSGGGYGIENLTGLDLVSPSGLMLVVGVPGWAAGSGGPARVLAIRV